MILFHEALVQETGGNEHALNELAHELHVLSQALVTQVAERIGMKESELWKRIDNKIWVMNADEALKYHVIDRIVDVKDLPKLTVIVAEKRSLLEQLLGK